VVPLLRRRRSSWAGDRRRAPPILDLRDLRGIDWATILLFGGGMCLGDLMGQTGVARAVGELVAGSVPSGGALVFLCAGFAIVVSELTSNTAAANMVVPVAVAVAQQAGVDPVTPALAATVACTFGFMLPYRRRRPTRWPMPPATCARPT
jgi:sodium-dependent dicarboxylate transporter 2/3/5